MTKRNRQTLRNFFTAGKLPTQDHFRDLVDSMLNMTDEGFCKSAQNGLEVSAPVGHDAFFSLYRDQSPQSALWSISCSGDRNRLSFRSGDAVAVPDTPAVLSLDAQARVGINIGAPRFALDVAGVIGAEGRAGTSTASGVAPPIANGIWQDITGPLTGCQALEVVAGTGLRGGGRFALLHAIALNTFNPTAGMFEFVMRRKRIRSSGAYYGRRCDQLQLRWQGSSGKNAEYRLQIRTKCSYGDTVPIQYFLTRLWFDAQMQGCPP
jgi:hypothetical protein